MDFFEVLKSRHSIRAYQDRAVEEEKLRKILEAVNSSPSAGNLQSYEVFLIKNMEKKNALVKAARGQEFIAEAPVVLIFCSNLTRSSSYRERGEKLYSIQDATIAASYVQLAVTALDLGSCWVGAFDEDKVLEFLGNPKGLKPVAIIPIGYPAEEPYTTSRRELNDITHEV